MTIELTIKLEVDASRVPNDPSSQEAFREKVRNTVRAVLIKNPPKTMHYHINGIWDTTEES